MIHEVTMEAVLAPGRLERAWIAVKRNRGAPGIDGKSIADTASHLREHWPVVRARLEAGSYTPSAVRGVDDPQAFGRGAIVGDTDGSGPTDPAVAGAGSECGL